MARRELEWSGTAAEPNRKCANLCMCVDSWDTPVQMCLQQWGFQSALPQRSQTFLLDSIRGTLESMHLEVMVELFFFLNPHLCSFPCQQLSPPSQRYTYIYIYIWELPSATTRFHCWPQGQLTVTCSAQRQLDYSGWEKRELAPFFPKHLQAHHSNLKDLQWFLTGNSSYCSNLGAATTPRQLQSATIGCM